jgi:mono/diheme cytochrome c family protein
MRFLHWAALALAVSASGVQAANGAAVYGRVCVACHQPNGVGAPGLAPALNGTLAARADTAPVRAYMAQVVVHGLSGRITVDGQPFTGVMPAQDSLSDEEIAAVLSYVAQNLAGRGGATFSVDEIKAARAAKPTARDLRTQREAALAAK